MNDVVRYEAPALPATAGEIRQQVNLIQEVMKSVMKQGTHYGVIPGAGDKPSLFKPGAEKLMATFRLAAEPEVEDLSGPDEVKYRVKVRLLAANGSNLGAGIGECSSSEEKYRWRKAVCKEEFNATPETRRRVKYARGKNNSHYTMEQVRTEPADVANTILKMAKKRGLVDAVLTVTAASDIFVQDIEDLPEELQESVYEERETRSRSQAGKVIQENEAAVDPEVRRQLVEELEKRANLGTDSLRKAWEEMPNKSRGIVGTDELNRLKKLAAEKQEQQGAANGE